MSASFNKLLLCPNEDALVAALDAASRRLGEGRGRDDWRPALAEVVENTEGRLQIESIMPAGSSQRYLSVAWWSDHQGRKHVRVVGGTREYGGNDLHHSLMDHDQRPPLWHVCPERVFRAKGGEAEPVWLVSCACGETGTACELGWAGECCGPCHDRREEGSAEVGDDVIAWADEPGEVRALAFDPRNRRLAVSAGGQVTLRDLRTGVVTVLAVSSDQESYQPLSFSPDGRWLVGGDLNGQVLLWDTTGEDDEASLVLNGQDGPTAFEFSPCGRFLAAVGAGGGLTLLEPATGGPVDFETEEGGVSSIAFDPKGTTLLYGNLHESYVGVLNYQNSRMLPAFQLGTLQHDGVHYLEYTPDAKHLIALTGNSEGDFEEPWHLRRFSFYLHRQTHHSEVPSPSGVAMSPDGRYLAMLCHDQRTSPAAVTFWDLDRWQSAGWIEWNPEDVLRCLAFSPDGRWLATGSVSGVVKLYPWRALLEG